MKDYLKKLIQRKKDEMTKLQERSNKSEDINEVRSIGESLQGLRDEITEAESELAKLEQDGNAQRSKQETKTAETRSTILGTYVQGGDDTTKRTQVNDQEIEARATALLEKRAVTISTGKCLLPKHTGTQINDTFTPVSTLVDLVEYEMLEGGESYSEPFVKSYGTGGITEDGAEYTTAEPVFDYADMNKVKITAYAEVHEEVKRLPHADYVSKVEQACLIALRKKVSEQIINGTGSKQLMGIFGTPVAINTANDIDLTAIDNKTLNKMVFAYGGEENVESVATAILNKNTVKALSEVDKEDGSLFYNIDINGKTINTVPYSINSNVKAFDKATAGQFVGAYGDPKNYKVVQFSAIEMKESEDYKFKEGIICYKVSGYFGGNVVKADGFLRAKKGA